MNGADVAHRAAERAARESYGKLLAYLAARCRDVDAAQDALADAFATALERWPASGVPRTPEAWLLVTARRRLFDRARHDARTERVYTRIASAARDAELALDDESGLTDERLAMLFACAHPALPEAIRGPLILAVVLGLDAARIASAFLVAPATMGQRLVRAKRKIAATRIPLRVPEAHEIPARLDAVLTAIYATFTCGWDDPLGYHARSQDLADEALWLADMVCKAAPQEPEAIGLRALMLHAHARRAARRAENGVYVPLDEQDPGRWDENAIDEAEALLERAATANRIGRFQLEAAIHSAHAARRFGRATDWSAIVSLYDALFALTKSPVVALNRAVAIGRLQGASAGIAALDEVARDERMLTYQPYWAARGDALARAGNAERAREALARAIGLTIDPSIRSYLAHRAERLKPT